MRLEHIIERRPAREGDSTVSHVPATRIFAEMVQRDPHREDCNAMQTFQCVALQSLLKMMISKQRMSKQTSKLSRILECRQEQAPLNENKLQ